LCIIGPQSDPSKDSRCYIVIRKKSPQSVLGFCTLRGGFPTYVTWLKTTTVEAIRIQLTEEKMIEAAKETEQEIGDLTGNA